MKKGVVLIATGSPYYGSWAINLAISIKSTEPDTHITLLYSGNALQYISPYMHIFNNTKQIPDKYLMSNGFESLLRPKVCLYDLSPYDETIFIDSDCIFFPGKKVSSLFEDLKDVEFTMGNRSKNDLSTDPRLIWCSSEVLRARFGDINILNLSSEFIYFKKTDNMKAFFKAAKKAFDFPDIEYNRFAGTVPDELAFQIAMIITGIEPHKTPYLLGYWEPYNKKNLNLSDLYKTDYYFYSIGGSILTSQMKLNYDTLAKVYAKGAGFKFPFLSKNKRDVINNRTNI